MPSKIEWTDETWNPVTGCTPISPGCDNCYARRMANRLRGRHGYPKDEPFRPGTLHADKLDQPLRWRKPRRVFVCSMGDLFHPDVEPEHIAAIFGVMAASPRHTFMVLTKRPSSMRKWFEWADDNMEEVLAFDLHRLNLDTAAERLGGSFWSGQYDEYGRCEAAPYWDDITFPWPLPNVYLGVTAENQEQADWRIPVLLQTPAAKRFMSCEPLLGAIDCEYPESIYPGGPQYCCVGHECGCMGRPIDPPLWWGPYDSGLDWVIAGGETGPGARQMLLHWARGLRDQCEAAHIPFFFKKVGGRSAASQAETPDDLNIRQFPEAE
jgi:protein gp37